MLDVQIGPDKEIEGAWLATGPRQSPRMVALGQRFGPGVLRHARLDEETDLPEVWMQSADVTCRASLPEEEWARTLTTEPSAVQPGSAREAPPPPASALPNLGETEHVRRNVQRLARAMFGASPKAQAAGSDTTPEAEPAPADSGAGSAP